MIPIITYLYTFIAYKIVSLTAEQKRLRLVPLSGFVVRKVSLA